MKVYFEKFYEEMKEGCKSRELFEEAKEYAYDYLDNLDDMDVFPSAESLAMLDKLTEPMPDGPCSPSKILRQLHEIGSRNTTAETGGRYFGFVIGSVTPVAVAAKWLSDVWDQNTALNVMSPISSKLEDLCEKWLTELFGLPDDTAAGLVVGSSMAIICGLAAARNDILSKQGWNVAEKGLFGAPTVRVVLGSQAHSSVHKALALLGFGKENLETVSSDGQGRMIAGEVPPLDSNTILILQAGNVNGGAFDPIDEICDAANNTGAWIHVDGAFGLWAAACENTRHLTKGIEKARSWSADAHKTLNVPYDCGIVLCRDRQALVNTMQASGSYIQFSDNRDGMLYTLDMSRRARSIELWATLKYFGKSGIDELINRLCEMAKYFAEELKKNGFIVENDIVFNQIIVRCDKPGDTTGLLKDIQSSGKCWCGGAVWNDRPVIRISVCSWRTTRQDVDECVKLFVEKRNTYK